MREHPLAGDIGLCLGLLLFPGLVSLSSGIGQPEAVMLAILALTVPLALRRRYPVASTAAVFAVAFVQWVTMFTVLPSDLAVLISLYSVAAYGGRRPALWGLGFALLGSVMAAATLADLGDGGSGVVNLTLTASFIGGFTVAVWVAGSLRGTRRAYLEAVVERAYRLEVEQEQQAQLAAAAERARIARDLHDVVAHSLSVIIAQADGGRYAARRTPESAVAALEVVSQTGRRALTDMRRLLGVLRDGNGELEPQPGVETVPNLVTSVRSSGLAVSLTEVGARQPLGAGLSLAAYRIVQEALTNVLKHAGPGAQAGVQLVWEETGLRVTVVDDGRGASAERDGRGQGVLGMRERAGLYGGQLEAGPRPGGGFRVHAFLPYLAMLS